jgi:hypothetical protein
MPAPLAGSGWCVGCWKAMRVGDVLYDKLSAARLAGGGCCACGALTLFRRSTAGPQRPLPHAAAMYGTHAVHAYTSCGSGSGHNSAPDDELGTVLFKVTAQHDGVC